MTKAFPHNTCAFLTDLAANNEKPWFEANRDRYEADFLEPAKDFVMDLAGYVQTLDPPHKAEPRMNGSIRRLHRDVRFSKDKTPYDPRLHVIFWTGEHPNRSPGLHVVLHPDRLGLGAGHWALTPEALDRYRAAVMAPETGDALLAHIVAAEAAGFALTEPALKRVPKGFEAEGKRAELLKRKGLVMATGDAPRAVEDLASLETVKAVFDTLLPLNAWLHEHVYAPG